MGLLSSLANQGQRGRGGARATDDADAATRAPEAGQAVGTDRDRGDGASEVPAPVLADLERKLVQVFALVGEAIAGATHALLACDREAAKQLMALDDLVDESISDITAVAQEELVDGETTARQRRELVTLLRMLPDLDRNGDLAEHIARRAARGLGAEMSPRSRGLVERMGEVAAAIWASAADAFAERSVLAATVVDALDDELDDLHVSLTAELATGTMPVPVAIELAMVARFYERFGDHAVNLARRMAALAGGGAEPGGAGAD
ncbi:MAG: phosphate signaling complex PhoU family protein [Acidimicrobiales bacterium]